MLACFRETPVVYPTHIAIIPDGNRRYSNRVFQDSMSGHQKSIDAMEGLINWCLQKNIPELSIFAWSSENWSRPPEQVEFAMTQFKLLLEQWIRREQTDIAFHFVSTSSEKLDSIIRQKMHDLNAITQNHSKLKCYIYVSYGFSEDVERAQLDNFRETSAVPAAASDPDVLIRTSGEQRLSNFCMWHLRYAELIFIRPLFPDCDDEVWDDCMVEYSSRQRRYGK